MRSDFAKTMFSGALIGMAAGMMLFPELDKNTRRRIKRTRHMVMDRAINMYDGIRSLGR